MFIIDAQSKIPIFEQLKKQILEFISIGVLSPDDKLPSVRTLANELGVNPNTVAKAYQELEINGYIYTAKGKGCFVSDNDTEQQIRNEKLIWYLEQTKEMKKHQIEKELLLNVINQVYEGGKERD